MSVSFYFIFMSFAHLEKNDKSYSYIPNDQSCARLFPSNFNESHVVIIKYHVYHHVNFDQRNSADRIPHIMYIFNVPHIMYILGLFRKTKSDQIITVLAN